MSARKIKAAAKKKGLTIVSADYYWTASPGESYPQWEIEFGEELDQIYVEDVIQYFSTTEEALDWINNLMPVPVE